MIYFDNSSGKLEVYENETEKKIDVKSIPSWQDPHLIIREWIEQNDKKNELLQNEWFPEKIEKIQKLHFVYRINGEIIDIAEYGDYMIRHDSNETVLINWKSGVAFVQMTKEDAIEKLRKIFVQKRIKKLLNNS